MITPRFTLDTKKGKKNCPIRARYSVNAEKAEYYTRLYVDEAYYVPKYWKGNKKVIKSTAPQSDYINEQLDIIVSHFHTAENIALAAGIPLELKYFRDYLDVKLKSKPIKDPDTLNFIQFFEQYIEDSKTAIKKKTMERLSPANAIKYTTVKNMMVDFGDHRKQQVNFADFNEQLFNELVNYMTTEKKYALNTIGRTIRFIKTVLKKATKNKVNTNLDFVDSFIGTSEDSDNAYLTEEELEKIYKHDFSNKPKLERVRDVFMIGCWTGLRFSDYTHLKKEHINNDRIKIITQKTKQQVIIPLHPTVKEILEKYNYQLPRAISNQKFNDYIQDVCEDAKINEPYSKNITKAGERKVVSGAKYEFITSHSARRTFATNAFKRKISPLLIMSITGHKTETEFVKYLKITNEERAQMFEEMAKW